MALDQKLPQQLKGFNYSVVFRIFFNMVFFSLRIFEAAEAPIAWERVDVTPVRYPDGTMGIPKAVIDSVNRNKVGLKSPLMTPGIERQKFILFQYNINGPNHIERSKCMDKKF